MAETTEETTPTEVEPTTETTTETPAETAAPETVPASAAAETQTAAPTTAVVAAPKEEPVATARPTAYRPSSDLVALQQEYAEESAALLKEMKDVANYDPTAGQVRRERLTLLKERIGEVRLLEQEQFQAAKEEVEDRWKQFKDEHPGVTRAKATKLFNDEVKKVAARYPNETPEAVNRIARGRWEVIIENIKPEAAPVTGKNPPGSAGKSGKGAAFLPSGGSAAAPVTPEDPLEEFARRYGNDAVAKEML